ncbi:hypothetical protein PV325_002029 [Microctonus aethiopoides]|nr:hypothetical protein PV325_002029 [Microctonus aethiopoides]
MIVSLAIAEGAPTSEHDATNPINTANIAQAVKADQHPIPVLTAAVATAPEALASTSSSIDVSSRSAPVAKQLFFADLPLVKTPASATKLASLTAPLIGPIAPFTYASPTILASVSCISVENGRIEFPKKHIEALSL